MASFIPTLKKYRPPRTLCLWTSFSTSGNTDLLSSSFFFLLLYSSLSFSCEKNRTLPKAVWRIVNKLSNGWLLKHLLTAKRYNRYSNSPPFLLILRKKERRCLMINGLTRVSRNVPSPNKAQLIDDRVGNVLAAIICINSTSKLYHGLHGSRATDC